MQRSKRGQPMGSARGDRAARRVGKRRHHAHVRKRATHGHEDGEPDDVHARMCGCLSGVYIPLAGRLCLGFTSQGQGGCVWVHVPLAGRLCLGPRPIGREVVSGFTSHWQGGCVWGSRPIGREVVSGSTSHWQGACVWVYVPLAGRLCLGPRPIGRE
eukprot:350252-Chlamydomonas_euryale.AAC.4